MKTKITYISIIVLLIGVIIYLLTQGNTQEERVEIKTTIEKIPVKVETPVYVPKWRTKVETVTRSLAEEKAALGPNADVIIKGMTDWARGLVNKGVWGKDDFEEFKYMGGTANQGLYCLYRST